jgi:hypothetical protein
MAPEKAAAYRVTEDFAGEQEDHVLKGNFMCSNFRHASIALYTWRSPTLVVMLGSNLKSTADYGCPDVTCPLDRRVAPIHLSIR